MTCLYRCYCGETFVVFGHLRKYTWLAEEFHSDITHFLFITSNGDAGFLGRFLVLFLSKETAYLYSILVY